ncbi:S-layer homology domain-containing protein [Paenibacillus sp. y28]|uniref:S-layer homology domain-containing protein n=1 Tax=Paenibacillus sp. y28 TaxID=3129110 RepID=UPI00301591B4
MKRRLPLVKQLTAVTLAAAMLMPAGIAGAETSLKQSFPDVKSDHWSLKYVTKLALTGIVQGDGAGNFNPDQNVTQEDAVIMAIRMMGLEDEAKSAKTEYILPVTVRADAKPYVNMAFDRGLILPSETQESTGKTWGSQPATREWVARLVVRAMGKESDAEKLVNTPSVFTDSKEMTPANVGYINAAAALGIVNGFDDGSFQPKVSVTRSQMAAFLSRADSYLPSHSSRMMNGYVVDMNDKSITIQSKDGQVTSLELSGSAVYFSPKSESKPTDRSAVEPSFEVTVIQEKGVAYYVEVTDDQVRVDTYEGKLTDVNLSTQKITLNMNGASEVYDMESFVSVVDKEGKGLSLGSLVKGSLLQIKRNGMVQGAKISQIIVKQEPTLRKIEGFFEETKAGAIIVSNKANGNLEEYTLSEDVPVQLLDQPSVLTALYKGDEVTVHVMDGIVTAIYITYKAVDAVDEGKLVQADASKMIVTVQKSDGKFATYNFSDSINVVIQGLALPGLKDLVADSDNVKLELKENRVVRIIVQNRNIQPNVVATVISFDSKENVVTVKDEYGAYKAYQLSNSVNIEYDEMVVSVANFLDSFPVGTKVNLTINGDKLLAVKVATKFEGVVSAKTVSGITITDDATGTSMYFKLDTLPVVDVAYKTTATISDIKVGDPVRVQLNYAKDAVGRIQLKKTIQYKIYNKDASAGTLKLVDADGNVQSYSTKDKYSFTKKDGKAVKIENVNIDDYVLINYVGSTIDSMISLDTVVGKITAIDKAATEMTVEGYNGTKEVYSLKSGVKVTLNSNVSTSISALEVGNRVQFFEESNGAMNVTVLAGEKRSVWYYEPLTRNISFKSRTLNDTVTYKLRKDAYIHQGTELFEPGYLVENDTVTVYVLGGDIIELEKN